MTSPIDRVNNIEERVNALAGQARAVADVVSREVSAIHQQTGETADRRGERFGRWVDVLEENNGLLGGRARSAILAEMRAANPGYKRRCLGCAHGYHKGKACSYVTVALSNKTGHAADFVDCSCKGR